MGKITQDFNWAVWLCWTQWNYQPRETHWPLDERIWRRCRTSSSCMKAFKNQSIWFAWHSRIGIEVRYTGSNCTRSTVQMLTIERCCIPTQIRLSGKCETSGRSWKTELWSCISWTCVHRMKNFDMSDNSGFERNYQLERRQAKILLYKRKPETINYHFNRNSIWSLSWREPICLFWMQWKENFSMFARVVNDAGGIKVRGQVAGCRRVTGVKTASAEMI